MKPRVGQKIAKRASLLQRHLSVACQVLGCKPLTTITSREDVEPLCEVLVEASIPLIEITLRDERTLDIIDEFKKFPEVHLGVGTIRSESHIDLAINASASFLITPGYSENLLNYAKQKNMPLIPGVQTPSEIMKANEAGLSTLKFFPAELSGGLDRLKAHLEKAVLVRSEPVAMVF